jgi:uncharacterized repeat protein (TIGR03943 family)
MGAGVTIERHTDATDNADASLQPRHAVHGVILLLTGGELSRLAWTGSYARYVKPGARDNLYAAGAVILVVALITLWQTLRPATRTDTPDHDEPLRHLGHSHRGFDVGWLLVVPMALLLLVAPPAIGSYEAARTGSALPPAPSSPYPPLPAGDLIAMSVIDYASRAVFGAGKTLQGRQVTLTGFLTTAPGGWYLTRMVVTCCAADAQPVKVGLSGTLPAGVASDQWMQVTGAYTTQAAKDPVNGATIPYLLTAAQPVAVPAQPYES